PLALIPFPKVTPNHHSLNHPPTSSILQLQSHTKTRLHPPNLGRYEPIYSSTATAPPSTTASAPATCVATAAAPVWMVLVGGLTPPPVLVPFPNPPLGELTGGLV